MKDLFDWHWDVFVPAAKQALHLDNRPVPGDHCKWCRAAGVTCFEAMEDSSRIVKAPINDESVIEIMRFAAVFKEVQKSAYSYLMAEAESGRIVPGLKAVRGRRSRDWINPETAEKELLKRLSNTDIFATKLKSPAQIEKLVSKEDRQGYLQELIDVKEGNLSLVLEDDPRPAVEFSGEAMEALED